MLTDLSKPQITVIVRRGGVEHVLCTGPKADITLIDFDMNHIDTDVGEWADLMYYMAKLKEWKEEARMEKAKAEEGVTVADVVPLDMSFEPPDQENP